jgi:2-polyprenyl-3-methyl-5-hydroxy-6-metoxy-1,4-benzoquinol methylase
MKKTQQVNSKNFKECISLVDAYANVAYDSPCMAHFNDEILTTIRANVPFDNASFLDIGCGKGYFLKYLHQLGYENNQGIEPSESLVSEAIAGNITCGSFEENSLMDNSFDIVFTCHTLHHLPAPRPVRAIREMLRIAKKYIVIVEINNTNIPMYFRSLILWNQEVNAFRYNIGRVRNLLADTGSHVIYSQHMTSLYLSGNHSWPYITLSKMGSPPYNISIAESKR